MQVDDVAKTVLIENLEDFQDFCSKVNNGNTYEGYTVTLGADIDLTNEDWTPIGTDASYYFGGTFDGNGHTISNLKIESAANNVGLFGYISGATIKNLVIENADVKGQDNTGVVVGNAMTGHLENITLQGTVNVTGTCNVGGITGYGYADQLS